MFIASGSMDNTAKIWDCTTGVCMTTVQHGAAVWNLTFNENALFTASSDLWGRMCDIRTGEIVSQFVGHTQPVVSIFQGNPGEVITCSPRELKIWDLRNDTVISSYNSPQDICCLSFAGNNRIVAGLRNGSLLIYNTRNSSVEYNNVIHNQQIQCLHTDGKSVVTGSQDHSLRVVNLDSKVTEYHLAGHEAPVNSVQMDDNKIVSGGSDMCMKVWNRRNGDCLYSLLGGSLQQRGNNPPHPQKPGCSQLMFDSSRVIGSFSSLLRIYSFLLTE